MASPDSVLDRDTQQFWAAGLLVETVSVWVAGDEPSCAITRRKGRAKGWGPEFFV